MNLEMVILNDSDYKHVNKHFDLSQAEAEFLLDLNNKNTNIYGLSHEKNLVGLVQLNKGRRALIYVYIDPVHRSNGYGRGGVKLCEQILEEHAPIQVATKYKIDDPVSKVLAAELGYIRKFSTTYMTYSGYLFDQIDGLVRPYDDKDYPKAHKMYAIAFHEMRQAVGDFPESAVQEATDQMRKHWKATADQRFIYTIDEEIVACARIESNEIGHIAVASNRQNQGIGKKFMKYLCNHILTSGYNRVDLFCVNGNKARFLYEQLGFKASYTLEYAEKNRL